MKFLDQAKIYIKAGNGGSGSASFEEKNLLSLVVLMEVTEVMEVQLFLLQIEI